jgi:hypothetical protein
MRNSRKIAAAAFVFSLSFATIATTPLQAAVSQSRTSDPAPSLLKRLIKEIRHALGLGTNDVVVGDDIITQPKP